MKPLQSGPPPVPDNRFGDLATLSAVAREAGLLSVAGEAAALAERLAAGRFFVVCLGQFKRGKSSILNALVGTPVLPVDVTPVTSVITILRHGSEPRAIVFYATGSTETIPADRIAWYVAEEHNPGNRRGVAAVEVALPAPLLALGLCLVDTPGIGSPFVQNTSATRAFIPHVDAALVVLGADPPISGDELALVLDVMAQVPTSIFVLNKADRLPGDDMRKARDFTRELLASRIGRPVGPILEVSAAERIAGIQTRDWSNLEAALAGLAGDAAGMLERSHQRGRARLIARVEHDLNERRQALIRPLQESEKRVEVLRRSMTAAQMTSRELGTLLATEQRRLLHEFQERQERFLGTDLTRATELNAWIDTLPAFRLRDRAAAFDRAAEIARVTVDRWLTRTEPEADRLYRTAVERFTSMGGEFLSRLRTLGDPAFAALPASLEPDAGLYAERHFYATSLMHLTAPGFARRLVWPLLPHGVRARWTRRDANAYLERLLRTNTTRAVFDLEHRVEVSRRQLEVELQLLLQEIVSSADRALEVARTRQQAGEEAVREELNRIDDLRERLGQLSPTAP